MAAGLRIAVAGAGLIGRRHIAAIGRTPGVTLAAVVDPAGFAQDSGGTCEVPIVLLLYTCRRWEGEICPLEGGEMGWFTPQQVESLAKPPLDIALAKRFFADLPD